jgi:hypothetical protein
VCNYQQHHYKTKFEEALANAKPSFERDVPDSMKDWFNQLIDVYLLDQKYRKITGGMTPKEAKLQYKLDTANQRVVKNFVRKYGYPKISQISMLGVSAVNSIIQHANPFLKWEFYPYLIEGYKSGDATTVDLAMFEDRLNTSLKRRQYYGTQITHYPSGIYFLTPVINVDSLDFFRAQNQLEPIATYLKRFNVEWDIHDYKYKKDSFEKILNINDSLPFRFVKP